MSKLTETQSILLSQAANRADGNLLPLPNTITAKGAALTRSFTVLLKRRLAEKVTATSDTSCWREEDGVPIGLRITPDGLAAIGAMTGPNAKAAKAAIEPKTNQPHQPAGESSSPSSCPKGKLGEVLSAVQRVSGATLAELSAQTGWQPHTLRAALTRLRQRGFAIALETKAGRKAYRCVRSVG